MKNSLLVSLAFIKLKNNPKPYTFSKELKKSLILITLIILSLPGMGQSRLKNQPKYDNKTLHFGFFIGVSNYDFLINPVENFSELPFFYGMESTPSLGYTINIISDLRLHHNLHLRFSPGFSSVTRQIIFDIDNPFTGRREDIIKDIESSFIDAPFELRFYSKRINNYRVYILGELKYALDLASKQDLTDEKFFKIKRNDLSYGFGVGVDFYLEFFKFSPQLKANFGLTDLLVQDGTPFVLGIESIYTRGIFISFLFE